MNLNLNPCNEGDCPEPGEYKVTVGNDEEGQFRIYWLCEAHMRELADHLDADPEWVDKGETEED